MTNETITIDDITKACIAVCEERKASNIMLYSMKDKSVLADYFLVCTAQAEPHLNAIAGHLQEKLNELGLKPKSIQGTAQSHWVIMDYINIIIHIFTPECRDFYKIEQLWPEELMAYISKEDENHGMLDENWSFNDEN